MEQKDVLIATLFHEGLSQRAIARQIGQSQPATRKRLIKMGLITSKPQSNNQESPPARQEVSLALMVEAWNQRIAPVSNACLTVDSISSELQILGEEVLRAHPGLGYWGTVLAPIRDRELTLEWLFRLILGKVPSDNQI